MRWETDDAVGSLFEDRLVRVRIALSEHLNSTSLVWVDDGEWNEPPEAEDDFRERIRGGFPQEGPNTPAWMKILRLSTLASPETSTLSRVMKVAVGRILQFDGTRES